MKYRLITLFVAGATAQQSLGVQPPSPAPNSANIVSALTSGYNLLVKIGTEAMTELQSGASPAVVVDHAMPKLLPELKLLKYVPVAASEKLLRPGSKKGRAAFGPYNLVARNENRPIADVLQSLDPRGQGAAAYLPKGSLCDGRDCTLLSARLGLTYEDGREATPETGVYIHHLLSFNPSRTSTNAIGICDVPDPDKDIGFVNKVFPNALPISPFSGRGEDGGPVNQIFTSSDGTYNSGYHLGKNDYVVVQSDLVNNRNQSQKVYLTYDYEYIDGFQGASAISTLLSVTGCLLIIPPKINMTGRAVTTSRRFPITNDATLLDMRGHMHDGGDKMILTVNNKTVCESFPEYKDKRLWSMSACSGPVDVKKGDWLTLASVYDVPKHPLRPGSLDPHVHAKNTLGMNDLMGMFGVVFAAKPTKK